MRRNRIVIKVCFALALISAICCVLWLIWRSYLSTDEVIEAVENGDKKRLSRLLRCGADVNGENGNGDTPLHVLTPRTWEHNEWAIKELYDAGADLSIKNRTGNTPLHYAAAFGQSNSCSALLKLGADPNLKDDEGKTALHYAAQSGSLEVIELLLAHTADLTAKSNEGETPLDFAIITKQPKEVLHLLTVKKN